MKILDVLDVLIISKVTQDLLKPVWHFPPSQVGLMLTNKSICEIMQSSLRICFELRLSEENGPTLSGRHHGPASSIPASQASLKSRRRCSRSSRCAAPLTRRGRGKGGARGRPPMAPSLQHFSAAGVRSRASSLPPAGVLMQEEAPLAPLSPGQETVGLGMGEVLARSPVAVFRTSAWRQRRTV